MTAMWKESRLRTALTLTLTVLALRRPVVTLLLLLIPDAARNPAAYYAAVSVQEALMWGLPALLLRPWNARPRPEGKSLGLGLCAAVFLGAAGQWVLSVVTDAWCRAFPWPTTGMMMPGNPAQWALAVLALVIVPALTEEAFFRGGLLGALGESTSPVKAFALSTLIFSLMHGSMAALPAHLVISALCTLVMLRWGRVSLCVVMHLCYNGTALILEATGAENIVPVTWVLAALILAAAVLLVRGLERGARGKRMSRGDAALCGLILTGTALMYLPDWLRVF